MPNSALFLHIQKTAGSSIVDIARQAYGSDQVVSHGDYLNATPTLSLGAVDKISTKGEKLPIPVSGKEKYEHIPFVSGHFGYDFARKLMQNRYTFTFLRDPIERVLSYYYFCKTRDPNEYEIYALTQQLSLDDFLMLGLERPAVKACIWNNQAWQLANGYGNSNGRNILSFCEEEILALAIQHLDDFSYIGFAETFEEDRDYILKELNIIPPKEKVVSNANPSRPSTKNLPLPTLKLLEDLTHLDRALYNLAWHRKNFFLEKPFKFMRKLKRKFLTI
jgi:hypothetical protein